MQDVTKLSPGGAVEDSSELIVRGKVMGKVEFGFYVGAVASDGSDLWLTTIKVAGENEGMCYQLHYDTPDREKIQALCESINAAGGVLAKGYGIHVVQGDGSGILSIGADEISPWVKDREMDDYITSQSLNAPVGGLDSLKERNALNPIQEGEKYSNEIILRGNLVQGPDIQDMCDAFISYGGRYEMPIWRIVVKLRGESEGLVYTVSYVSSNCKQLQSLCEKIKASGGALAKGRIDSTIECDHWSELIVFADEISPCESFPYHLCG